MRKDRRTGKGKRSRRNRVFSRLEPLEARVLLAADFGAVGTGTANWSNLSNIPESPVGAVSYLQLEEFEAFNLDSEGLSSLLANAPMEFTAEAQSNPLTVSFPTPDGSFENFAVFESPIMAPELAAKYPEITTYAGYSLDNPATTIRFDMTPQGFHAQVLGSNGSYMIDPYYHLDQSVYVSYDRGTSSVDSATMEARRTQEEIVVSPSGELLFHSAELHDHDHFGHNHEHHDHDHYHDHDHLAHDFGHGHSHAHGADGGNGECPMCGGSGGDECPGCGRADVDSGSTSSMAAGLDEVVAGIDFGDGDGQTVYERTGTQLRTYRLANATTVEYTNFHGGTKPAGQAAVVTAINRVTQVYEVELTIRLELVPNNDDVVFVGTDSYSNNNGGAMLSQNQTVIDSTIGSANYDIGHVFSTGGGGVAFLGVVGVNGAKAGGVTGLPSPIGDAFYVDYVAHEMGHQFNATHTFNGNSGSCSGGNRTGATAYEPGSGSTIMAYAGICGNDNLQNRSDPYFHSGSLDNIINYVDNIRPGVGTRTATGNSIPTADAGPDYVIPAGTPYRLTGSGSDPDGDTITYNWESRDRGPQADVNAPDNGSSPLFRSWEATTDPVRYLPRLQDLVNNTTVRGETLPTVNRPNHRWRLTVRDNVAGAGAVDTDDMIVNVVDTGTPFEITSFNSSGAAWTGGSTQTITWDVAGTDSGTINTPLVNVLLSTDGGFTYPTTLASFVPNDGSQDIVVPLIDTTQARIMVEGVGNIFFDINNQNIEIIGVDDSGPLATATAPDIATQNSDPQTITVTYQDPSGVDSSDIDSSDIQVSGPAGTFNATFISKSTTSDDAIITATYEVAAPGGIWDFTANGTYNINMIAGEVTDTIGNAIVGGTIGSFTVDVEAPGLSCDNPHPAVVGDGAADLFYNPVTGIMSIRIDSDTPGDGVVGVLIPGPDAINYSPPGAAVWGASGYFNGQVQLLIYNNDIFSGLEMDLPLVQYATGLTEADFGCVEWGTIGAAGNPAKTNYSNVGVVSDTADPTAVATAANVSATSGGSSHTFTVEFTDNSEVEYADIETGVIVVTGPNGYSEIATVDSVSPGVDAASLTATLTIPAAGGTWDAADIGTYTISVVGFTVSDLSNNFVAGGDVGTFQVTGDTGTPGDFDNDGDFDCDDVDTLSAAIIAGSTDPTFDLDSSGTVDVDDLHYWVITIKGTLLGDANLDFNVDGSDFIIWNNNKFESGNAWCTGDFDGNGFVDGADFLIWNANKFQTPDAALAGRQELDESDGDESDALGTNPGAVQAPAANPPVATYDSALGSYQATASRVVQDDMDSATFEEDDKWEAVVDDVFSSLI